MLGFVPAGFSDLSSATQNRNLAGQRGHLRAHGLDVRLVVQALRIVGHAVAQLEQTVGKALKDCIALARCSHGLHQVRCREEGTPVSSAEILPCSPTAHSLLRAASPHRAVSTSAQPRSAPLLKVNERCGPGMAGLHPTTCSCRLSVSDWVRVGRVSESIPVLQLPPESSYLAVSTVPSSHLPFLFDFPFSSLPAPFISQYIPSKPGRGFCSAIFF